jgi:hypothetical protein
LGAAEILPPELIWNVPLFANDPALLRAAAVVNVPAFVTVPSISDALLILIVAPDVLVSVIPVLTVSFPTLIVPVVPVKL